MTQLTKWMLIGFCLPLLAGHAQAELILDLKYSDGSTSQAKNVGDTIFLDLSITETAPDTILADEGLFTGGGRILRTVGNAVFGAPIATDIDANWDLFDDAPASSGTGVEIAKILGTSFGLPPTFTSGPGFAIGTVKIAQFAIQITGGSGLSTLTADILGAPFDAFSTFTSGTILDSQITSFSSVNLTVNGAAVPEPATVVLGGMSLCVAGAAAWRRRRVAQKTLNATA